MSHFVTTKDICKYTNLLMTIPNLGERRYIDALNTIEKVQIPIVFSASNCHLSPRLGIVISKLLYFEISLVEAK